MITNGNDTPPRTITTLEFSSVHLLMAAIVYGLRDVSYEQATEAAHELIRTSLRRRREYLENQRGTRALEDQHV